MYNHIVNSVAYKDTIIFSNSNLFVYNRIQILKGNFYLITMQLTWMVSYLLSQAKSVELKSHFAC